MTKRQARTSDEKKKKNKAVKTKAIQWEKMVKLR